MSKVQPMVFLVDDDAAIRDSLALLLSLKGFSNQVFASAETFLEIVRPESRGCLLTDLRMPGMSGLDLMEQLLTRDICLPVVMLTAHGDVATTRAALKAGAFDFLEKPVNDDVLVDVLNNAITRDAERFSAKVALSETLERYERLTPREREVAKLLAEGLQNREVAEHLRISPRTVEVYKARLMQKLDCRNVADLLRIMSKVERPS